uniref:Uncharacterized protein n=1 Tax=Daphnia galeata TaxID=27404 RepID=A0A8J2WQ81_9CRUS|nr:unnamed protein product [Daphnia galeata]
MQQKVLLSLLMVVLMVSFSMADDDMDESGTSFVQKRAATSMDDNPKNSHPMSHPGFRLIQGRRAMSKPRATKPPAKKPTPPFKASNAKLSAKKPAVQ